MYLPNGLNDYDKCMGVKRFSTNKVFFLWWYWVESISGLLLCSPRGMLSILIKISPPLQNDSLLSPICLFLKNRKKIISRRHQAAWGVRSRILNEFYCTSITTRWHKPFFCSAWNVALGSILQMEIVLSTLINARNWSCLDFNRRLR